MTNILNLRIPPIDFTSHLTELVVNLEAMKSQYKIAPHSFVFLQLREIFSMLESLQSARIEGNRTTIADYTNNKFSKNRNEPDSIEEIKNIENAISYVDYCYENSHFKLNHLFLKELHGIVTSGLKREGSNEQGTYRNCNVTISNSKHTPPLAIQVPGYMDELVEWINKNDSIQNLSLKVALAHHTFTWIHPFDNGNGRMSRVLTYAMLKQYGFDMVYLLNPSAVFCIDRNKYFDKLQIADSKTDKAYLEWCEYVLEGLNKEMKKIIKLMDKDFLHTKILLPAINQAFHDEKITKDYKSILELSLRKGNNLIKSKDIQETFPLLTPRQINFLINKMLDKGFLRRIEPKSRSYMINLINRILVVTILDTLQEENFCNLA